MRHRQIYIHMVRASVLHGTAAALASWLLFGALLREISIAGLGIAFAIGVLVALLRTPLLVRDEAQTIATAMVRQLAAELVQHYSARGLPPDYDIEAISERALYAARVQLRSEKFYCLDPELELRAGK